jgi:hypothetical protein
MSIKKEKKESRINLLVPVELRKNYKLHCLKNDIGMSERIRKLIENDLNDNIKGIYYAVLTKTLQTKQKNISQFSTKDIHNILHKPIFPVTLEQIEVILEELYTYSILRRWEYENGEIKYELTI